MKSEPLLTTANLENRAKQDADELATFVAENESQIRHWIHFRMDKRLGRRLDIDDVLQESYLAGQARWTHYQKNPEVSLKVWFRSIVLQTLIDLYRQHLLTQQRDINREQGWNPGQGGAATSVCLLQQLAGHATSPSQAVAREELIARVTQALQQLNEADREVLALRHFEALTNQEVAEVLQISEKAASIRYVRALQRMKPLLHPVT